MSTIYVLILATGEIGTLNSISEGSVFVLLHTPRGYGEVCLNAADVEFQPASLK